MAQALRFDAMITGGEVKDYAELARLRKVTRAWLTQVMSLIYLAPDVVEDVLFLSPVMHGRDPITLRHLLPIAATADWRRLRRRWQRLQARGNPTAAVTGASRRSRRDKDATNTLPLASRILSMAELLTTATRRRRGPATLERHAFATSRLMDFVSL